MNLNEQCPTEVSTFLHPSLETDLRLPQSSPHKRKRDDEEIMMTSTKDDCLMVADVTDVHRSPKRLRRSNWNVLQTATAATVGAAVTWGLLAYT